jgi:hypothetical protein
VTLFCHQRWQNLPGEKAGREGARLGGPVGSPVQAATPITSPSEGSDSGSVKATHDLSTRPLAEASPQAHSATPPTAPGGELPSVVGGTPLSKLIATAYELGLEHGRANTMAAVTKELQEINNLIEQEGEHV